MFKELFGFFCHCYGINASETTHLGKMGHLLAYLLAHLLSHSLAHTLTRSFTHSFERSCDPTNVPHASIQICSIVHPIVACLRQWWSNKYKWRGQRCHRMLGWIWLNRHMRFVRTTSLSRNYGQKKNCTLFQMIVPAVILKVAKLFLGEFVAHQISF